MVLGEMIGMEPATIVSFDQAQSLFYLLSERHAAIVHMVEYAKLHLNLNREAVDAGNQAGAAPYS